MPDLFNLGATGPVLTVVAFVVILALLASYVASRYRVANANEALIIAGSRGSSKVRDDKGQPVIAADDKGIRVVVGGGTFVLPLVHKVGRLKLTARQISVQLPDAVTSQGIKVAVQGVATFKIGRDVESIRNAAERFLDARDEQIDSIVKNVLEGSLRSIVGTLTIEELIMDRQKLLQQVQDSAKGDLATSGLQIDAFTIQSINDESGYVDLLGQQKLSVVERDARMAKATTDQEAAVREAQSEQIKIDAQRDVALRRAEVETATSAANARAGQAGPLAQAEAQQEVTRRQTELAELEAGRKEKELLTSIVRPAEADAEAIVRRAQGDRQATVAAAQADAERVKLAGEAQAAVAFATGEAHAKVVQLNAQAESQRLQLEGNAEAGVVFTKGEAEAKALALRAEAYRQFNEAAVIQTVLGMLPEIVRAAAEPMSRIDSLTVLSNDGASEMVKNGTRTVAEASATVKGLTGLDIPALISDAIGRHRDTEDGGSGRTPPTTPRPSRPARGSAAASGASTSSGSAAAAAPGAPTLAARPADLSPEDAVRAVDETGIDPAAALRRAEEAIARASRTTSVAAQVAEGTAAGAAQITADMPLSEAARILAAELRQVPGVEQHLDLALNDVDYAGSRMLRAAWRLGRGRLAERYGDLTVGEFIERFGGDRPA